MSNDDLKNCILIILILVEKYEFSKETVINDLDQYNIDSIINTNGFLNYVSSFVVRATVELLLVSLGKDVRNDFIETMSYLHHAPNEDKYQIMDSFRWWMYLRKENAESFYTSSILQFAVSEAMSSEKYEIRNVATLLLIEQAGCENEKFAITVLSRLLNVDKAYDCNNPTTQVKNEIIKNAKKFVNSSPETVEFIYKKAEVDDSWMVRQIVKKELESKERETL
jgi:hypothetical protein